MILVWNVRPMFKRQEGRTLFYCNFAVAEREGEACEPRGFYVAVDQTEIGEEVVSEMAKALVEKVMESLVEIKPFTQTNQIHSVHEVET